MGRISELREKEEKGKLSEAEEKELKELLAEAKDAEEVSEEETDEEKALDEAADKFVEKATAKLAEQTKPLEDLVAKLSKSYASPKDHNKTKFIVDPQMGRVPVEKLDEVEIKVPGREKKQHKTVTKRTLHYLQALLTGDMQKVQVLVEGTAALGGYLVPEEWSNILVEDRRDAVVMRQLATTVNVSSDTYHLAFSDTRPHVAWRSEAAVKATTTAQFNEITLTPYSLAATLPLSDELVADATVGGSVIQIVTNQLVRAIAEEEEKAFWTGNGSGRPTGIDNYSFTEVGVAAGASDTVRADAYKASYWRLGQGYRNQAVYAANARTWARAHTLKESTTNAYLLQRLPDSPLPVLNGRPCYEVNDLPDGRVFFGDFSNYYIGDREGIRVKQSDEATVAGYSAFERDLTWLRVEERVDAELVYTRAVVELNNMGAV